MSVKSDYLKHKETLRKHGKMMVVASIVSLVAFLLLLLLPCFSIGGTVSFSLLDEFRLMIDFVLDLFKGKSFGIYTTIFNVYSIVIVVTIIIGMVKAIVIAISTITKMSNADMYIMETYDKIVHRAENKKNRKAGPWDMAYASIVTILLDIIVVRVVFKVSTEDFVTLGGTLSNIVFIDGITIWGIIVAMLFVSIIVLNIIASSCVRKVKKAVIKAEYEDVQKEKEEPEKKNSEEVFEESK